jgi:large subunit ribosomal protein L23|tara:strand:- start:1571 stop:1864 length:294 start_codon:yes stop_codon:yes gene_type:complete
MSILIKPIITEKATNDSELKNCFTFHVEKDANKVQIKNIIESFYGVKVKKVRTINVRSNSKIRYTKSGIQYGKTNSYKKAIVQLHDGETIDLYANSQ